MLSSPIVPADSVLPVHCFLDVLNTPTVLTAIRPAALTAIRVTLAVLALGLLGMYLYARKKSRKEAPPRN